MKKIDAAISVVVPVYNSQNTLKKLMERLEYVLGQFDFYEIILVDDGSRDKSLDVIREIALGNSHVKGISIEKNSGQQCAILCGLRHAKYEYSVIIDDDLEQAPEDIKKLYEKMLEGYDAVYGIPKYTNARHITSFMRDVLFRMITKIPKGIKVSSFRMINKHIKDAVIQAETKFVYISMEILKHTQNIANITIERGPKAPTNYSFKKLMRVYKNIIATYSGCFLFRRKTPKGDCYKVDEVIGDTQ